MQPLFWKATWLHPFQLSLGSSKIHQKKYTSVFSVNLLALKNVAEETLVNDHVFGKWNAGHENA